MTDEQLQQLLAHGLRTVGRIGAKAALSAVDSVLEDVEVGTSEVDAALKRGREWIRKKAGRGR
jgi:hypothetical protein